MGSHDELLAKIDRPQAFAINVNGMASIIEVQHLMAFRNALRAVVELHKPKEEDGKLWCSHEVCYNHIEFLERNDCDCSYPCPTIQAIEKELK